MLLLNMIDISTLSLSGVDTLFDHQSVSLLGHQISDLTTLLAQNMGEIKKIDVLGDFQKSFQNFIKTGQVWALGIGLVIGWLLKGFLG
jgi:hypothetical protein